MSVYFALRTHYDYPTGKHLRCFPEDDTVLAWFQRHWKGFAEYSEAREYAKQLVGATVYGFYTLFEAIATENLPCPKTNRELVRLLNEHLYVEGEIIATTHAIQILTDDDELELAYYFFDDHFLAQHADKAAYLLYEEPLLPTAIEEPTPTAAPRLPVMRKLSPRGTGIGSLYCVFASYYDSSNLTDTLCGYRIERLRLPELLGYLSRANIDDQWPVELQLLRALTAEQDALQPLMEEAGRIPLSSIGEKLYEKKFGSGTPAEDRALLRQICAGIETESAVKSGTLSQVQVTEHLAQLILHSDGWDDRPLFQRWILFDDVWLTANPVLGKAILRFAARWDVLT